MRDSKKDNIVEIAPELKGWQKPEIKTIEIAETAGAALMGNDGGGGMTGS